MAEATLLPSQQPVATPIVQKQVGFITKGGGMDIDAWVAKEKEKNPNVFIRDFPDHVEFYVEEKKK